ncbi:MAG: DUF2513 domain-containing protein [Pseudomonadota bacterium]
MNRDLSIVRAILLQIEASDTDPLEWVEVEVPGASEALVSYHVQIMDEAGLVVASDESTMGRSSWVPNRLTWNGHEFLDAVKDEDVFKETQGRIARVAGWSFPIVLEIATALVKEKLGLPGSP